MLSGIDHIISVPYKPRSLAFSPDGRVLVIAGNGSNVMFWCISSGVLVDIPVGVGVAGIAFLCPADKHRQMVAMLTAEPISKIIAVGCSSTYLPGSCMLSGDIIAHSGQMKTPALCIAAHSTRALLATSAGTEVKIWEVLQGAVALVQRGTAETIGGIDDICSLHFMSNTDSLLITYCYHKEVRILNPLTMEILRTVKISSYIYSSAVSPCENYIIIHDSHKAIELWRIDSGERKRRWEFSIPTKGMWKKYPIVWGKSHAYAAGAEGQIIALRIDSDFPPESTVTNGRIFAMSTSPFGRPLLATAVCATSSPSNYLVEIRSDEQRDATIDPAICIHYRSGKKRKMSEYDGLSNTATKKRYMKHSSQDSRDIEPDGEHARASDIASLSMGPKKVQSSASDNNNTSVVQLEKPMLPVNPPIWAQSRQEICETLSWFRSYQSGVYFTGGLAKGYLLSAFGANRDIFCHNGRLIISHGGGSGPSARGSLSDNAADQDPSVGALLKSHREGIPIGIVIDDKYVLFPYNLSARQTTYAVLGFYHIIHAWEEFQLSDQKNENPAIQHKFAFQWCEGQGDPWWMQGLHPHNGDPTTGPSDSYSSRRHGMHPVVPSVTCSTSPSTKYSSPDPMNDRQHFQVPQQSDLYTCCHKCKQSSPQVYIHGWMCLKGVCNAFWKISDKLYQGDLCYSPKFLELLQLPPLSMAWSIFPQRPLALTKNGRHCVTCGRLSNRFKWEQWECHNCKMIVKAIGAIYPAPKLDIQGSSTAKRFWTSEKSRIICSDVRTYQCGPSIGTWVSFDLPGGGYIHLIMGGATVNAAADKIFRLYQEQALDGRLLLRRYPLQKHKLRGILLSNYFSHNAGEPYKYVSGTGDTVPLLEAPSAVQHAIDLIRLRSLKALGRIPEFNEVLSAAYLNDQKMSFHTDDEMGLGPTIASLSLGSDAVMRFRCKKGPGADKACLHLKLTLRHGDVLVMDGAHIQKNYVHAVEPVDLRIAATARFISPGES